MNIYVGNLPHKTSDVELRQLFERFGTVASAVIIKDRETRMSRGFGFVEMADENEGNAAINELNGQEYEGRPLKINEARPREERPAGGSGFSGGARSGGYGERRSFGGGDRGGYGDRRGGDRGGYGDRRGGGSDRRGGYDRGGY